MATIGLDKLYYAKITEDLSGNETYGTPMPKILGQPAMEKVVQGAIVKLTNGEIDAAAAYDEIKKGIDEVVASQE